MVWIIVSTVRLWFYASKPIHARSCLFEGSCQSMRSFVKNIFSNPTRSKKPIYFVSLLVLVMFTCLPTIFSSLMADEVLCDPNVAQGYNCTVWESTESKRIATGTLLIAQALIPGFILSIPVLVVMLFPFMICCVECEDED